MLYVVRHGQTEWNREGRYQGWRDSPLTARGRHQAQRGGSHLIDKGLTALYCSPIGRARATAAYVESATNLQAVEDDRLRECRYGVCEGMTQDEIDRKFPGKSVWRAEDKWRRTYPDAETYGDLFERAGDFVEETLGDVLNPGAAAVCVVAHDAINRALVGRLLGWPPERIMTETQRNNEIWAIGGNGLKKILVD